jgi:hypothetical protein
MAYINQDTKKVIAAALKPILAKYGLKGSLSIRNHMTLVLTIREGSIDFFSDVIGDSSPRMADEYRKAGYIDVNPYHYERQFMGTSLDFLNEAFAVLNKGNWDKSDIMTDYFNVGWYVDLYIGKWNKPYKLTRAYITL